MEAQLIYEFAEKYNYSVDLDLMEFKSILIGLASGKIDLTGYLAYTDERAESILYTPSYFDQYYIMVVRSLILINAKIY